MHDFERPTDIHDSLVELLRRMDLRPLTRLICSKSGIELDRDITIRERSPTIAVPSLSGKRRKRIADVAFTVHGEDDRVLAVLV